MSELFDEYSDQFLVTVGPFGTAITFRRSPAVAGAPGSTAQGEDIGVIRMSLEHLKLMTFILKRQLAETEQQQGIIIPISPLTLNAMKIAPEDWDSFWKKPD